MVIRPLFDPGLRASSGSYPLAFILQAGSACNDLFLCLSQLYLPSRPSVRI